MNFLDEEYIFNISSFPFIDSTLPPFLYMFSSNSFNSRELNWGKALSIEMMWSVNKSLVKFASEISKHPCCVLLSLERYPPHSRRFPISLAIDLIYVPLEHVISNSSNGCWKWILLISIIFISLGGFSIS